MNRLGPAWLLTCAGAVAAMAAVGVVDIMRDRVRREALWGRKT